MEVLLFNSDTPLTPQQIIDVQSYLSSKWGLTATVDSDGDGFTDTVEIANGSTVTDASSTPQTFLPLLRMPSYGWMPQMWMVATTKRCLMAMPLVRGWI